MAQGPLFSWCEHMNVTHYRADVHKHNSSPVCVYLTVSTVDVAVVLPVEGAVDRAVFFSLTISFSGVWHIMQSS